MNQNTKVLAIDIGNTRTHIALVDTTNLLSIRKSILLTANIENELLESTGHLLCNEPEIEVNIASVNESAATVAVTILKNLPMKKIRKVRANANLGITISYENSEKLGADRIADCLYASRANPGANSVIIDSGTAVTVNLLRNGTIFLGGIIAPGVSTQLRSLNAFTNALPLIDIVREPIVFPGNSTKTCILAGVVLGISGALEKLISQTAVLFNNDFTIFATGGSWEIIAPYATFPFTHVPDLTMIGTALFTD